MKYIVSITLLFLSLGAYAQDSVGKNRWYPVYSYHQYFDKTSVILDNRAPSNTIQPNNPTSYYVGINFEHITKSGFVYGGGLFYGRRKYDINIYHDLSNFDPDARIALQGKSYNRNILASVSYWGPRLLVGYKYKLPHTWSLNARFGFHFRGYLSEATESNQYKEITYKLDDQPIIARESFLQADYKFGGEIKKTNISRRLFKYYQSNYVLGYDMYVAAERSLNYKYLKSICIGIEMTRDVDLRKLRGKLQYEDYGGAPMRVYARNDVSKIKEQDFSQDFFIERNISLGIRLGVGLWK